MSANKNFSRRHGGTEVWFVEFLCLCGIVFSLFLMIVNLSSKFERLDAKFERIAERSLEIEQQVRELRRIISVPPCLCENPPAVEATP